MTCAHCGQNNFSWVRTCASCGGSLLPSTPDDAGAQGPAPAVQQPVPQRELQLALPDVEGPAAQDARAIREAFAHTSPPLVMPILVATNVLIFLAMIVTRVPAMSPSSDALLRWGATYGPAITGGEWWRLLTAMFVHAGLVHLVFNMFALLSIGALIERMFGRVPFLVLYLLSGLGGSIASAYWHPLSVGVGASGAIFGLYGALGGFLLRARNSLPSEVVSSLRNNAIAFIVYNGVIGSTQPNIDMAAHFGGLAAGILAGVALATSDTRSRTGLRTTVAVGIAGAAMLTLAATRLPAFDDWAGALRTLGELEKHGIDVSNAAMRQVTDGRIDADAFARLIEAQVIAPWRQHRTRIAAMQRLPDKERRLAAKALQYMDHRAAAWQFKADAFRTEDMALVAKSNAEEAAASEAGDDLLRLLGAKPIGPRNGRTAPAAGADAGERELAQAVTVVDQLESASVKAYNSGLERFRSGRLSQSAFADLIETQISQPWDRHAKVIAGLHTIGPVEGSRKRVEQFMRLRGDGWHLMARAFRTQSAALARQANELFTKAAALMSTGTRAGGAASAPTHK